MTRKVFFVGFNKTGTTSIHQLCASLGLRSCHAGSWTQWPIDSDQWSQYDAFSDGECADFAALDARFPDARFVLNVRRLDEWVLSRYQHVNRNQRTKRSSWQDNSDAAIVQWIRKRNAYHQQVMNYFSAERKRDRFLVLDYCGDNESHKKLTAFLGFRAQSAHRRPAANRSRARRFRRVSVRAPTQRRSAFERALLNRIGARIGLAASDWKTTLVTDIER